MYNRHKPTILGPAYTVMERTCSTFASINPFKANQLNFPFLISRTRPYPILGVLGVIFHFYSNSNRTFCEQTVEVLIRRRVLRRLIWICTVCLCPTKGTLSLYGLKEMHILVTQCQVSASEPYCPLVFQNVKPNGKIQVSISCFER